jgi:hypothetical protein
VELCAQSDAAALGPAADTVKTRLRHDVITKISFVDNGDTWGECRLEAVSLFISFLSYLDLLSLSFYAGTRWRTLHPIYIFAIFPHLSFFVSVPVASVSMPALPGRRSGCSSSFFYPVYSYPLAFRLLVLISYSSFTVSSITKILEISQSFSLIFGHFP